MQLAGLLVLILAAPAAPLPDKVSQLQWLAGAWEGDDGGTWNEEVWAAPRGGLMLAYHRDTRQGRAVGFEFLRIEETPAGLVYRPLPGGHAGTDFKLVEAGPRRAVFESGLEVSRRLPFWRGGGTPPPRVERTPGGKVSAQ